VRKSVSASACCRHGHQHGDAVGLGIEARVQRSSDSCAIARSASCFVFLNSDDGLDHHGAGPSPCPCRRRVVHRACLGLHEIRQRVVTGGCRFIESSRL
jgi:hypothetical protein